MNGKLRAQVILKWVKRFYTSASVRILIKVRDIGTWMKAVLHNRKRTYGYVWAGMIESKWRTWTVFVGLIKRTSLILTTAWNEFCVKRRTRKENALKKRGRNFGDNKAYHIEYNKKTRGKNSPRVTFYKIKLFFTCFIFANGFGELVGTRGIALATNPC